MTNDGSSQVSPSTNLDGVLESQPAIPTMQSSLSSALSGKWSASRSNQRSPAIFPVSLSLRDVVATEGRLGRQEPLDNQLLGDGEGVPADLDPREVNKQNPCDLDRLVRAATFSYLA